MANKTFTPIDAPKTRLPEHNEPTLPSEKKESSKGGKAMVDKISMYEYEPPFYNVLMHLGQ
jgi:hypothetical protein